jgi:hypothetical protein
MPLSGVVINSCNTAWAASIRAVNLAASSSAKDTLESKSTAATIMIIFFIRILRSLHQVVRVVAPQTLGFQNPVTWRLESVERLFLRATFPNRGLDMFELRKPSY